MVHLPVKKEFYCYIETRQCTHSSIDRVLYFHCHGLYANIRTHDTWGGKKCNSHAILALKVILGVTTLRRDIA